MELSEINRISWELAPHAMMKERGKCVVCSTGKLRELYECTARDGFREDIKRVIREYSPPPEKRMNAEVFRSFGERLLERIKGLERDDARRVMQYLLWNARSLEDIFRSKKEEEIKNGLKRRFEAEGVDMALVNEILVYWRGNEGGRSHRDRRRGGRDHGRR
ncbi:MAG: hypothetical protein SBU_001276 [Candidatus Syntrophoarchaeum butanivorans]|uniref:Uncharacterized protein n=1 Tax=Candidatus Syntropharchaeum butanivorans TaxID=1839936 RepID=A0A1F2P3L1_9EURY|nr:MAG: hypothetical protein SBU_001276 [Candidatus Syntrophoarchaeum butanivorans]